MVKRVAMGIAHIITCILIAVVTVCDTAGVAYGATGDATIANVMRMTVLPRETDARSTPDATSLREALGASVASGVGNDSSHDSTLDASITDAGETNANLAVTTMRIGEGGHGAVFSPLVSAYDQDTFLALCDMGGLYTSHDAGESWNATCNDGRAWCLSADPNTPGTFYAGGSGLWRSTDNGDTWQLVLPKPEDIEYTQAKLNHNRSYYFSRAGDGYQDGSLVVAVAIDAADSRHIVAMQSDGYGYANSTSSVSESFDGGASFETIATFTQVKAERDRTMLNLRIFIEHGADAADKGRVLVAIPDGIYEVDRTTDTLKGLYVTPESAKPSEPEDSIGAVEQVIDKGGTYHYVVLENVNATQAAKMGSRVRIWHTSDFSALDDPSKTVDLTAEFAQLPRLYHKTSNKSETTTYRIDLHDAIALCAPSLERIYVSYRSYDTYQLNEDGSLGKKVSVSWQGACGLVTYDASREAGGRFAWNFGSRLYWTGADAGVRLTPDHNYLMARAQMDSTVALLGLAADPKNPRRILLTTHTGLLFSPDIDANVGGRWDGGWWYDNVNIYPRHSKLVDSDTTLGGRITTGSPLVVDEWRMRSTGLDVTVSYCLREDPFDPQHLIRGLDDGCQEQSFDGGATWSHLRTRLPSGVSDTCYDLVFDEGSKGEVWASFDSAGGALYTPAARFFTTLGKLGHSTDGGVTWVIEGYGEGLPSNATIASISVVYPRDDKGAIVDADRTLYVATMGFGIYVSHNSGHTFTPMNAGIPAVDLTYDGKTYPAIWTRKVLATDDGRLFALTQYSSLGTANKNGSTTYYTTQDEQTYGNVWEWDVTGGDGSGSWVRLPLNYKDEKGFRDGVPNVRQPRSIAYDTTIRTLYVAGVTVIGPGRTTSKGGVRYTNFGGGLYTYTADKGTAVGEGTVAAMAGLPTELARDRRTGQQVGFDQRSIAGVNLDSLDRLWFATEDGDVWVRRADTLHWAKVADRILRICNTLDAGGDGRMYLNTNGISTIKICATEPVVAPQPTLITFADAALHQGVVAQLAKQGIDFDHDDDGLSVTLSPTELSRVTSLALCDLGITDLTGLGSLTALSELDLSYNHVVDLTPLQALGNLTKLVARGNDVSSVAALKGDAADTPFAKLSWLDLSANRLADDELAGNEQAVTYHLRRLPLAHLDLAHNKLRSLYGVWELTSLTYLDVYDNLIHDLSGLDRPSGIQWDSTHTPLGLLAHLDLGENNRDAATMRGLDSLKKLSALTYLDFSENHRANIAYYLRYLYRLRTLQLEGNDIADANLLEGGTSCFNNLTSLTTLILARNRLTNVSPILGLRNMRELSLRDNRLAYSAAGSAETDGLFGVVSDAKTGALAWPRLAKLDLLGNFVSDGTYQQPHELTTLYALSAMDDPDALELGFDYRNVAGFDTAGRLHTDADGTIYTTYDDFGARRNGTFDDYIAIYNAHVLAAQNDGCEVRATVGDTDDAASGRTYHIFKPYASDIAEACGNACWQGATFLVHDEGIDHRSGRFDHLICIRGKSAQDASSDADPTSQQPLLAKGATFDRTPVTTGRAAAFDRADIVAVAGTQALRIEGCVIVSDHLVALCDETSSTWGGDVELVGCTWRPIGARRGQLLAADLTTMATSDDRHLPNVLVDQLAIDDSLNATFADHDVISNGLWAFGDDADNVGEVTADRWPTRLTVNRTSIDHDDGLGDGRLNLTATELGTISEGKGTETRDYWAGDVGVRDADGTDLTCKLLKGDAPVVDGPVIVTVREADIAVATVTVERNGAAAAQAGAETVIGTWERTLSDPGTYAVTVTSDSSAHHWTGSRTLTFTVAKQSEPDPKPEPMPTWGDPRYTWSANDTRVTATRVRTDDATKVEVETVGATGVVTRPATDSEPGEMVFTSAEFANEAFTRQIKTATIPAEPVGWQEASRAVLAQVASALKADASTPTTGAVDLAKLIGSLDVTPCPKMGWVGLKNGAITTYELYFDDYYVLKTTSEERVRRYDPTTLIDVRDFGATGDGVSDDTASIKAAVTALNERGGILYFPLGTYVVSTTHNHGSVMLLESAKHIEVDLMCSTLRLAPNGYTGYYLVKMNRCADAEVRNGTLVGDRINHDYVTTDGAHPYGMGVQAAHSTLCAILNMDVYDMTGDALYTMNFGQGLTTISDCTLHHCRRQGLSITSADVVNVSHTDIHDIGTSDGIDGTAPMSGIDIEPNSLDHGIGYVLLDDVHSHDNTRFGVVQASSMRQAVYDVDVTNSVIERLYTLNSFHIAHSRLLFTLEEAESIGRSTMEDTYVSKAGTLYLNDMTIDNCVFEGNDIDAGATLSMRLMPKRTTVTNTTFKNVQGRGNYASGGYYDYGMPFYTNSSGSWGFAEGSGHNTYKGCSLMLDNFCDTGSTLTDCQVYKRDKESTAVTGNELSGCTIRLMKNPITFDGCVLTNCSLYGAGGGKPTLTFHDSRLTFEGIASKDFLPGTVAIDASKVQVMGECASTAFSNVAFSNLTEITLGSCQETDLVIPNSAKDIDYTVAYTHTWNDPIYKWDNGHTSVTATHTCTTCGTQETETVTDGIAREIVLAATCTEKGETAYTATFVNPAFATTTETVADIAATGHDWDGGTLTVAPTCEGKGVRTFTCTHDASHTRTEDVDPTGHAWSFVDFAWTADSTTGRGAVARYRCDNDAHHMTTVRATVVVSDEVGATYHADGHVTRTATVAAADSPDGRAHEDTETTTTARPSPIAVRVAGIMAVDKTYDGTTDVEFDAGSATFVDADGLPLVGDAPVIAVTGSFVDANAGKDKTVNINKIVLEDDRDGRYVLDTAGQQERAVATIRPKAAGLTWGTTHFGYDGVAHAPVATATGLVNGDVCDVRVSIAADRGAKLVDGTAVNAGAYTATATSLANPNYQLVDDNTTTAFTIERAPLAKLAVNIVGWVEGTYDAAANAPHVTGNLGGGEVSVSYKAASAGEEAYTDDMPTAAGSYMVRASVTETTNYLSGTATAGFTIEPRPRPAAGTVVGLQPVDDAWGGVGLVGGTDELAGAIPLNDTDRGHLAGGGNVIVWVEASDDDALVPPSIRPTVVQAAGNHTVGAIFDLRMFKRTGDTVERITQLAAAGVTVGLDLRRLALPAIADGHARSYAIVRIHNGNVDVLDAAADATGMLTFVTDRFSTYALTYLDQRADDTKTNPINPDSPEIETPPEVTHNAPAPARHSATQDVAVTTTAATTTVVLPLARTDDPTPQGLPWLTLAGVTIMVAGIVLRRRRSARPRPRNTQSDRSNS